MLLHSLNDESPSHTYDFAMSLSLYRSNNVVGVVYATSPSLIYMTTLYHVSIQLLFCPKLALYRTHNLLAWRLLSEINLALCLPFV
jgi:hypothetical protein